MKYIYLIVLCISILSAKAQEKGTQFRKLTLPEALTLAQQNAGEPQLIFIDCYTEWCAPCKMMVKEVFPQEKVGSFMNTNFICLKLDMEKEGLEIGRRFKVKSYPTFLILDKDGIEVGRITGGNKEADDFLLRVRKAMIPKAQAGGSLSKVPDVSKDEVLIQGNMTDEMSEIILSDTRDGKMVTLVKAPVDDKGNFRITFKPTQKGIYTLSDGMRSYRLYLSPGVYADLTLSDGDLTLNQTNSQPLRMLAMWDFISAGAKKHSLFLYGDEYAPEKFFNELNGLIGYTRYLVPEYMTNDAVFNKLMPQLAYFDIVNYALYYARSTSGSKLATADLPAFYQQLFQNDFLKENTLMQLPYGSDLLTLYTKFASRGGKDLNTEQALSLFVNPLYKGELVLKHVESKTSYDDVLQLTDRYAEYLTTDSQKSRKDELLKRLLPFKRGNKAFPFTFTDAKGKSVSLTDFKGKLVLVDVWATTCAPCKTEFPYLKKLVEQFKGKDIVFVGVSTDVLKNKEVWNKYINDEKLPGVQLFAGGWESSLTKDYQISYIPRYMLFDKNGNIITVDAPLPSNPELGQMIEEYLSKE